MTVDELQVLITADTNKLRKEISSTNSIVSGLQKQVTKMGSSITSSVVKGTLVTTALSKAFSLVTQNISGAIDRLDTLNNYPRVMSNLGISTEDADASMARLNEGLLGLPTTLNSAVSAVQRFTSANGNVKASTEMYLALNNAILAGGASMDIQNTAMEQLSQSYAKGKPDMMEWRSAMTAMPAQLKQVALAMGYASANDLGEALRGGTVSMNEFLAKMVELNHTGANGFQSFEEQARNATGGVATSITNVKTAITRGLTEIMNTIGQSNIAGFFQGIARAINAVIPYVSAFVKVIGTAVSFIAGLFGKTNSVTQTANKATSAVSNLGSVGASSSKGLDSATGSAKKLKKELNGLAGFDEMNVIKEPADTSSGSGGSGGADVGGGGIGDLGNIDLSAFDTAVSNSSSKVDELYNKMMSAVQWFTSDMNFQPLVDSFYNLSDAINYLITGAGGLLGGFIENYLKPIATYVVNDALPQFFNATADAIKGIDFNTISTSLNNLWKALTPFTKTLFNGLLFFYEDILLPFGKIVINDLIPGFLELLAGALTILDTAISNVEPILSWLWNSILLPMSQFVGSIVGDVLTAIGNALTVIGQNEVAVTILESIAIAIGLIQGAILLYNVAVTALTVAHTLAGVATSVFATAMTILTSPITLVIAAITALVAIVILLVNHWDEVKEMAIVVWEKIKEVWGVVSDWFNDNIITPVKNFFTGMWDTLKTGASNAWNGIKNIFNTVANWFNNTLITPVKNFFTGMWDKLKSGAKGAWDGIKNVFSTVTNWFKDKFSQAWNAVKNIFSTGGKIFSGIKEGIENTFKTVVNGIIDGINKVIKVPFDAINRALNKIKNVGIGDAKPFSGLPSISVPQIPKLAKGTVVDKPTVAMIGEAGKEVVMPLERNTGWIDKLGTRIANIVGTNNDVPINLIVNLGDEKIFDKFIQYTREKSFETNGEVFSI